MTARWLSSVYTAALEKKLTVGGTVLLTVISSDFSVPTDTLLDAVQTAIDPTQNAGEGYGLAPIGHVVSVKPVQAVEIFVAVKITFDTGFGWSNLQNEIENIISDYLLELRETWADSSRLVVRVSRIESRVLDLEGVIDIQDTALNGAQSNLILSKFEVPVFGGVTDGS